VQHGLASTQVATNVEMSAPIPTNTSTSNTHVLGKLRSTTRAKAACILHAHCTSALSKLWALYTPLPTWPMHAKGGSLESGESVLQVDACHFDSEPCSVSCKPVKFASWQHSACCPRNLLRGLGLDFATPWEGFGPVGRPDSEPTAQGLSYELWMAFIH
jgi:hypothetical protein